MSAPRKGRKARQPSRNHSVSFAARLSGLERASIILCHGCDDEPVIPITFVHDDGTVEVIMVACPSCGVHAPLWNGILIDKEPASPPVAPEPAAPQPPSVVAHFCDCGSGPMEFAWCAEGEDLVCGHCGDSMSYWPDESEAPPVGEDTPYRCPGCCLTAWSKPEVKLACGRCSGRPLRRAPSKAER